MHLYYITGTSRMWPLSLFLLLLLLLMVSCYINSDFPLKGWKKQNENILDIVMEDGFISRTLTCSLGTTYSHNF